MKSHRRKEFVNLVELIRNRQRNQPYIFSASNSYRRNIRRRDNIVIGNTDSVGPSRSRNPNQSVLSNNLQTTKVFRNSSSSSVISSVCNLAKGNACGNSEEHQRTSASPSKQMCTVNKPESHVTLPSCGCVNNFDRVSTIPINEIKTCQEKTDAMPNSKTETSLGIEKKCSAVCTKEILVHSNQNDILSPETDNNTEKLSQPSSVISNIISSNESEEVHSINVDLQSVLQNHASAFVFEHVSSRQILADEEAGGDGHHNDSVIEIEITLHSSNDPNSDEEVEVEGDEHVLEPGE